jgi:hypothetical protein
VRCVCALRFINAYAQEYLIRHKEYGSIELKSPSIIWEQVCRLTGKTIIRRPYVGMAVDEFANLVFQHFVCRTRPCCNARKKKLDAWEFRVRMDRASNLERDRK